MSNNLDPLFKVGGFTPGKIKLAWHLIPLVNLQDWVAGGVLLNDSEDSENEDEEMEIVANWRYFVEFQPCNSRL